MNHPSSNKIWIISGVIIIVLALFYFYFSGGISDSSLLQPNNSDSEADIRSARVLSLLNQVNNLEIKTDVFKSAAYQSLQDYSVDIPKQPVGRANPFAPF